MVTTSTTDSGDTTQDTSGSSDGSILDFFMQPIGLAMLAGVAVASAAGWAFLGGS